MSVLTTPLLTDADFARLLTFRTALRRFEQWSRQQAATAGLTHAQHQVLLVVRAHADRRGPTIGDIADALLIRHHSAVELVDRVQEAGFVLRRRDTADSRVVRVRLTDRGGGAIEALSALHIGELRGLAPLLDGMTRDRDLPDGLSVEIDRPFCDELHG